MIQYGEEDAETVRAMFIRLYDENKDVTDRVLQFQSDVQDLCERLKWISCIHRLECDLYAKNEMVRVKSHTDGMGN